MKRTPPAAAKQPWNKTLKEVMVKAVRKRAEAMMDQRGLENGLPINYRQGCMYYAAAFLIEMRNRNVSPNRFILQAGSACWPRLTREQDDGEKTTYTHFSYVFEMQQAVMAVIRGVLPEMHVWVVQTDTLELIDLTTGFQEQQCLELIGEDWPGVKLPSYLWTEISKLPQDVRYEPDYNAIQMAGAFIQEVAGVNLIQGFDNPEDVLRMEFSRVR